MNVASLRAEVSATLDHVPIDFGGGCSVSKATVLAHILKSEKIRKSIDIGIYRGRSYFPQALVHTKYTRGKVIGIDPYSKADAMEYDEKELQAEITQFVDTTDFDELYATVEGLRTQLHVEEGSEIMRTTSDAAAVALAGQKFGLIHIDGNHDTEPVLNDVRNYLPLLDPSNGFLVLDDISWRSVRPAVDLVTSQMTLLYARVDTFNDYAVFWNGTSSTKKAKLRASIALAGEN